MCITSELKGERKRGIETEREREREREREADTITRSSEFSPKIKKGFRDGLSYSTPQ